MTIKEQIYIDGESGKIFRYTKECYMKEIGSKDKYGYLTFSFEGKMIKNHRFIYEKIYNVKLQPNQMLDHINQIKDDNRVDNLRIVNRSQNEQNKPKQKNRSSIYKGISWEKNSKKWTAKIQFKGKLKHLGYFNDEISAVKIYNKFVKDNNLTYIHIPEYQKNL